MKEIEFNPITFPFLVVKKAYPDLRFNFHFSYIEDENALPSEYNGPWGRADLSEDVPVVLVDPRLPICAFPEILLHEVAHVVMGVKAQHGPKWKKEFDKLRELYHQMFFELYGDPDA